MLRGWRYAFVFLLFFPLLVQSETRVFTEFVYDESGNIVGIQRNISQNPPVVGSLSPNVIRIGQTFPVTVTGSDLQAVEITPEDENVIVSNTNALNDLVTFNLFAGSAAPIGSYTLTFTTPLGSTTTAISIQPRAPSLTIAPSPLAISPGVSQALTIRLSGQDVADNILTFSSSNPALLSVSPETVTITQGDTLPGQTVTVTALNTGTATLSVSVSNLPDVAIPVFITGEFVPPEGDNQFFAPNVGVEIGIPDEPELVETGPFVARPIGVLLGEAPQQPNNGVTPVTSNQVRLAVGDVITAVSPSEMAVGSGPIDIVLNGVGLDAVTAVSINPADDITLDSFNVMADGTTLTVPATIAESAAEGLRQIVLSTNDSVIPVATPGLDRINIAIEQPSIESINPVVVVRDSDSISVTVRGQNLNNVQSINIVPATGMVGSDPQTFLDGRMLTFDLAVPADEPLGSRVLSVTTDAGTTTTVASAANTFEVVNGPVETLTPITAPTLGVELVSSNQVGSDLDIRSNIVGISLGNTVLGLSPEQGRIGTDLTLTISGIGLESVADIIFTPNTGITTSNLVASSDGSQVTVDISIAPDAPEELRRIDLVQADLVSLVTPVSSDVNRFLVVGNQPTVSAVIPNFVLRGAGATTVTVLGEFLDDATTVSIAPSANITVSAPVVASDGRSLSVNISADSVASLGERVLVVSTPAGTTSSSASAANTFTVADIVTAQFDQILSPIVGVQREVEVVQQPTIDQLFTAPNLGVEVEIVTGPDTTDFNNFGFTQLGTVIGDIATSITPSAVALNSTVTLIINGVGLTNVDSISLNPSDGVTVSSPTVNGDSTQASVELTIASDATLGARQVILNTASDTIGFADLSQSQLNVVVAMPQIDSISPIQAVAGDTVELVIRGINLGGAVAVSATPSDDITFATAPFVNTAGTEVSIQMNVAAGATAGPRVITVISPVGESDATASAANTFTVVTN